MTGNKQEAKHMQMQTGVTEENKYIQYQRQYKIEKVEFKSIEVTLKNRAQSEKQKKEY